MLETNLRCDIQLLTNDIAVGISVSVIAKVL
jgi:hypothetical protein